MPAAALKLPSVTLAAVTSIALDQTARAVAECLAHAEFARVLWISDAPPPGSGDPRIEWIRIAPLRSREAYSRFVLQDLGALLASEHVLLIQWDGYILDPSAWRPEFLEHDYIGAPWPQFGDGMTVGNGGFSLRSKRLLLATATFPETQEAEDIAICRTWRPRLEAELGVKFAPAELAQCFAFERTPRATASFGFHGAFNLVKLVDAATARDLVNSLEMHVLARNELRELTTWALRRGQWRLAGELIRRRWHRRREQQRTKASQGLL